MGELVVAGVLVLLVAGVFGGAALLADRSDRKRRRRTVAANRAAVWEVVEVGALQRTQVFIRKVTADGDELERIAVASVSDGDPQWDALIIEARATAANRAAMLNIKP